MLPAYATGMKAVLNSLRIHVKEMGPLRTFETWTGINPRTGFDCQSCAWADPLGLCLRFTAGNSGGISGDWFPPDDFGSSFKKG